MPSTTSSRARRRSKARPVRRRPAASDRDAVAAELVEAVAIARHPEETRHHRGDDAERLHAADLGIGRLVDVDHHPAAVADRHLLVDRLVGAQAIFDDRG